MKKTEIDNITKAKAQLVVEQPFFASLLLGMPMTEDNSIPTMATNGDWIKYNSTWTAKLTLPEMVFVLAHEVMHCVFQHMYRKNKRHHLKWNIAADFVINDLLHQEKIGIMPKLGLYDPNIVIQGKGTTEGVYNVLPDPPEDQGPGQPGGPMDDVQDGAKDEAEAAQKEAEMKVKVMQAQNAAKACGKVSAGIERLVGEFTKPKIDWKIVLRNFLTERAKVELSYARPKRRWLGEDLVFPSLSGERVGNVVVAIDCSGSIGNDILNAFGAEIKSIIEDVCPKLTHVIYFDSEVLRKESFESEDPFKIRAVGGGGTAFSPIFKSIEKDNIEPVGCVVLTDLQCSDFGKPPGYPVLWASTDLDAAPFGDVVKLKI